MKTFSGQIAPAVLLSLGIVTFAYAIDRVGSPPPGETTTSPAATIQGELLRIEGGTDGGFYTVKDAAGNTALHNAASRGDKRQFWAWRRKDHFWGNEHLWQLWDGKPVYYDWND